MTIVQLNLSDELQQFLVGEAQAGKYASTAAYIEKLIERAKNGKDRFEALLVEGLDSGEPIPFDAAELERIRGEVHKRLANG